MKLKNITISLIISSNILLGFDFGSLSTMVEDGLEKVKKIQNVKNTSGISNLTVNDGLKEALSFGVNFAIKELGNTNGYLKNSEVKILLPENIQKIEGIVRKLGGNELSDKFIKSMNASASQAVPKTSKIILESIKKMSIKDVQGVLKGGNESATNYFKKSSSSDLKALIMPIVTSSMNKNNVSKYYDQVNALYINNASSYINNESVLGFAKKLGVDSYIPSKNGFDINNYVADKTLDGLFKMISKKEKAIRTNPREQTTALLKKVFSK